MSVLGVPVSRRMRDLVNMALGTRLLIIPELRVLVLTKKHVGSGNEIHTESEGIFAIVARARDPISRSACSNQN